MQIKLREGFVVAEQGGDALALSPGPADDEEGFKAAEVTKGTTVARSRRCRAYREARSVVGGDGQDVLATNDRQGTRLVAATMRSLDIACKCTGTWSTALRQRRQTSETMRKRGRLGI